MATSSTAAKTPPAAPAISATSGPLDGESEGAAAVGVEVAAGDDGFGTDSLAGAVMVGNGVEVDGGVVLAIGVIVVAELVIASRVLELGVFTSVAVGARPVIVVVAGGRLSHAHCGGTVEQFCEKRVRRREQEARTYDVRLKNVTTTRNAVRHDRCATRETHQNFERGALVKGKSPERKVYEKYSSVSDDS